MSAAAGAPPPPPPPPPPRTSGFDDLPAELLLMIYRYIGLNQFLNLAVAIYPTLLRHRMVPELTLDMVNRIMTDDRSLVFGKESAIGRMPMELWLIIAEHGEPANSVALHWALGLRFWRSEVHPGVSAELMQLLRTWSRRSKEK